MKTLVLRQTTRAVMVVAILMVAACGEAPLGSVGERSSGWINEPEVVTTTTVPRTVPKSIGANTLYWFNDHIATESAADAETLIAEVFSRREGDRFIQASRFEVATALPAVRFPAQVPSGAEWVSSQLVIENSGLISDDPSAAFGIWSAEPYTRSRSVAQMAVLSVAIDKETAGQIGEEGDAASCARFVDQATNSCDLVTVNDRQVWNLTSSRGTTLIWFEGEYRYELFGRTFVPREAMEAMASETIPLVNVTPPTS